MAIIKKVRGFDPKIGENCFLADSAVVVGDVTMGTTAASGSMPCCAAM
jgi:carbonic anhydrase/acetyltransferase-like protein (isoleucine patch superfamily)